MSSLIEDFSGRTFVAFMDISGFKEMMKTNMALNSLNVFYQAGYDGINNSAQTIEGVFVSDCGVIFANSHNNSETEKFQKLLEVIRYVNEQMLQRDYLLTTSIAYGNFEYHHKIEFPGIEKNPIYGNAYLSAYLDQNSKSKIQPGMCRLIDKELPSIDFSSFPLLKKKPTEDRYYYYYWNIEDNNNDEYINNCIEKFEDLYRDSYQSKFRGMIQALKSRGVYENNN